MGAGWWQRMTTGAKRQRELAIIRWQRKSAASGEGRRLDEVGDGGQQWEATVGWAVMGGGRCWAIARGG